MVPGFIKGHSVFQALLNFYLYFAAPVMAIFLLEFRLASFWTSWKCPFHHPCHCLKGRVKIIIWHVSFQLVIANTLTLLCARTTTHSWRPPPKATNPPSPPDLTYLIILLLYTPWSPTLTSNFLYLKTYPSPLLFYHFFPSTVCATINHLWNQLTHLVVRFCCILNLFSITSPLP